MHLPVRCLCNAAACVKPGLSIANFWTLLFSVYKIQRCNPEHLLRLIVLNGTSVLQGICLLLTDQGTEQVIQSPDLIIYYIDKSVLVENRLLVKFIQNWIWDLSGVFSTSSLVRISMTSFPAFTLLFVQKYSCLYNVWFQKISIPSPWMVTENSKGVRGLKGQNYKVWS